jgi:hypothetical protein
MYDSYVRSSLVTEGIELVSTVETASADQPFSCRVIPLNHQLFIDE